MRATSSIRRYDRPLFLLIATALVFLPRASYAKYSPDHPEVKDLVQKGLGFLEQRAGNSEGEKVLTGLAFLKGQKNKSHPRILEAVEVCKVMAAASEPKLTAEGPVYTIGVAIIFLCELDAEKYRPEIQRMLSWMLKVQKGHGGWGYPHGSHERTGDTSMSQYGALSLWTASHYNYNVPEENVARVTNWLMRTQDPSGGWGYQGNDPGNFNLVPQSGVSHSLTAAGVGSLYVCGDILNLKNNKPEKEPDLPPGVQRVVKEQDKQRASNLIDRGRYNNALAGGNTWFEKNGGINDNVQWVYYYMYALERYMSFYEYAKFGEHQDVAPWYDVGVEFLKKKISKQESSWSAESGAVPGTCFAVLFLVRSTRKSIEKAQKPLGGELAGGKGLSGALETARVDANGKVVTEDENREGVIGDIGSILAQMQNKEFGGAIELPSKIELPNDKSEREKQLESLRKLVSAEKFEARMLAVNTLVTAHSLDNAPVLIYALTDPDNRIALKARDELRYLSRRFTGFNMPDNPSEAQKARSAERWRDWYYSIRPEAEEREEIVLP